MVSIGMNVTHFLRGLFLLLAILSLNKRSVSAYFEGCDHTYIMEVGHTYELRSYKYPQSYPPGSSCRYRYIAPENYNIYVTCTIELDNGPDGCTSEAFYIAVDGDANLRGSERLCGAGTFTRHSLMDSLVLAYTSNGLAGNFICSLQTRKKACECGWGITRNIANGDEAAINEFPSAVALTTRPPHRTLFCSATIISNRYLLTAAHCALRYDLSTIEAWVGRHNIDAASPAEDTRYAAVYYISERIVHPGYDSARVKNDIALLHTSTTIKYSRGVGPICLPFSNTYNDFNWQNVEVIGWGATSLNSLNSPTLQKITVLTMSNPDCADIYSGINTIYPSQICTRDHLNTQKDSCQADSGGPLIFRHSNRQYQVGVISYGKGCGYQQDPTGVNTRVTSFLPWIYQHTGPAVCVIKI